MLYNIKKRARVLCTFSRSIYYEIIHARLKRRVFHTARGTLGKLRHRRSRFSQLGSPIFTPCRPRLYIFFDVSGLAKNGLSRRAFTLHPLDESRSRAVLPSRVRTFKWRVGTLKKRPRPLSSTFRPANRVGGKTLRSDAHNFTESRTARR